MTNMVWKINSTHQVKNYSSAVLDTFWSGLNGVRSDHQIIALKTGRSYMLIILAVRNSIWQQWWSYVNNTGSKEQYMATMMVLNISVKKSICQQWWSYNVSIILAVKKSIWQQLWSHNISIILAVKNSIWQKFWSQNTSIILAVYDNNDGLTTCV